MKKYKIFSIQQCQLHTDCCSRNCLTFRYKCIKSRNDEGNVHIIDGTVAVSPVVTSVTQSQERPSQQQPTVEFNNVQELVDRFGEDASPSSRPSTVAPPPLINPSHEQRPPQAAPVPFHPSTSTTTTTNANNFDIIGNSGNNNQGVCYELGRSVSIACVNANDDIHFNIFASATTSREQFIYLFFVCILVFVFTTMLLT